MPARWTVLFLLGLLCSSGAAESTTAEQREAERFLASLRKLDDRPLGTSYFAVFMGGVAVGKGKLAIERAERDGEDCYRITRELRIGQPGPGASFEKTEGFFTPGLRSLHSREARGTGEVESWSRVTERKFQNEWEEVVNDESSELQFTFEGADGHLPHACEELAILLLPTRKGRIYEFVQHQRDIDSTPRTFQVEGVMKVDGVKLLRVQLTDLDPHADESGELPRIETVYWLGRDGLARVDTTLAGRPATLKFFPQPVELPEPDLEALQELARPADPVLLYWHARSRGNEELLRNALDVGRMVEILMDRDDDYREMSKEVKELAAVMIKEKVLSGLTEAPLDATLVPLVPLMTADWLQVTLDGEEAATVEVKEALPLAGLEEVRRFQVEKHSSGRWKVVELVRD